MFVQQLVNGLMLGGAYALVAIGYTLIFGVLNLLHLAHGDIFMVGAYVGLALTLVGFPPWATLGGAMLATAENPTIAGLMGINVSLAIVITFAVASALAGAAGVLLAWNFTGLSPFFGVKVGLKGLAIMLLGGLGNVTGAMVGGLVIGVVEVLSVAYLASSYRDAFAFAVMILILLVRPTGLLGARLQSG